MADRHSSAGGRWGVGGPNAGDPANDSVRSWLPAECYILQSAVSVPAGLVCEVTSLPHIHSVTSFPDTTTTTTNNNNNTSICKAHIVSIRAESEAPAVARWTGWLVVVV